MVGYIISILLMYVGILIRIVSSELAIGIKLVLLGLATFGANLFTDAVIFLYKAFNNYRKSQDGY